MVNISSPIELMHYKNQYPKTHILDLLGHDAWKKFEKILSQMVVENGDESEKKRTRCTNPYLERPTFQRTPRQFLSENGSSVPFQMATENQL